MDWWIWVLIVIGGLILLPLVMRLIFWLFVSIAIAGAFILFFLLSLGEALVDSTREIGRAFNKTWQEARAKRRRKKR